MSAPSENQNRIGEEEFIRLFALSQGRVFAFIVTFLPDWGDAEEVLARTSVVLWQKWSQFQRGGDFVRWACGIAHRQTMAYLRECRRQRQFFSEEVVERLVQERLGRDAVLEARRRALRDCLGKLSAADRQIIDGYYVAVKKTAAELAAQLGRPANTVLKALIRIRRALHHCIDRKVAVEERP